MRKSSRFVPALTAAASHPAIAPLPDQVSPVLGLRYFGATFRPAKALPRGFGPGGRPRRRPLGTKPPPTLVPPPPRLSSWARSSLTLPASAAPTSSRSLT